MIDNTNVSNNGSNNESFQRYIGVASVNVVGINPNNDKLRALGWEIAEGAEEPVYAQVVEKDGKKTETNRLRLMVQIQDLDDKPIIPIDFWCRNELAINSEMTKCKIIDSFGRTAWATKDELKNKQIPQYKDGPARIDGKYKPAHSGEEQLVTFLFKYLNITPYQIFDRTKNTYVDSKNPGHLTIDDWGKLCKGDVSEIADYIALQPDNCCKVILGVRTTDNNRTYQTFLSDGYLSNCSRVDVTTGVYNQAQKLIDRFNERYSGSDSTFSAEPVHIYENKPTEVKDNSASMFEAPSSEPDMFEPISDNDQLPF